MMESVNKKINPYGIGNNGLAKLNLHIHEKLKDIRDGSFAEGQGCSEEESKINDFTGDMNDGQVEEDGLLVSEVGPQKHQRIPRPVVRWERFLPVRTLKVLLVENDNSTRQVLSALLRNCGYEVVATSNGMQAWKMLEDLDNHIDLVLTEVVMACLSGFGLLCKIMKHKTCKNIPVIMMSSNDSMCTVFKCLSKGAVDFLVKPIRKNELKNLWQHIWRRCHSSSASGSESGIQTRNSTKSDDSDNNAGSNDNEGNGSIGLNVRDGSDNGSGTQNSWTKRAVEVDTPRPMSPSNQLANPKPEAFCNRWVPVKTANESHEQKELAGNAIMGTDLEIGIARTQDVPQKFPPNKVLTGFTVVNADNLQENDPKKAMEDNEPELESSSATAGLSAQAEDLIGGIGNSTVAQVRGAEAHNGFSTISESKDKTVMDSNELPSLQLSLKRPRSSEEDGSQTGTHDNRNVLRHSDQSAFSRYNALATSSQDPTGYRASCSVPCEKSSEPGKTESMQNMISSSNAAPLKQGSNGSSYGNDMGSTTKNVCTNPPASKEKTSTTSVSKPLKNPSAFRPLQHRACTTQEVLQEKADNIPTAAPVNQARVPPCQVQVQHHRHHYHHLHHHVHNMLQQQKTPDHNDLSLKNMAALSLSCGSSNMLVGAMDDNAANFSLKGSNSCGNRGSNGHNGSSIAVSDGMNVEIDKLARTAGAGDGNENLAILVDQNPLSRREAAIDKFRRKRKERNFEKKVRYQSRKRLAEQRPRVRGQFVRQNVIERRKPDADS